MSSQPPLFPSLYALLPSSSHSQFTSHLSLLSIHIEPYTITDTIYTANQTVIPQSRSLRLRHRYGHPELQSSTKSKGRGKETGEDVEDEDGEWSLAYLSPTLSGREYGDMNVRGLLHVDIVSSSQREIEEFIKTLGFSHSHGYTKSGLLFHLPLPHPTLTLHLTITRLLPPSPAVDEGDDAPFTPSSEPYLVQLHPSRPVQGVASKGELGLVDVMGLMRSMADRIDLDWGTGR